MDDELDGTQSLDGIEAPVGVPAPEEGAGRAARKNKAKQKKTAVIAGALALLAAVIAVLAFVLIKARASGLPTESGRIADVLTPAWKPVPPESFYGPLSGVVLAEDAHLRRPLAVKVENEPPARPQSGLDRADVIYEVPMEGNDVTRYVAIYQSRSAATVGPVRSARLADVVIVPQYKGLFAHCGGVWKVLQLVKRARITDLDEYYDSEAYWRASFRRAPHNLYTSTSLLWDLARRKKAYKPTRLPSFGFKDEEPRAARPVSTIQIPFGDYTHVRWEYARKSNSYLRHQQGAPHNDNVTGRQLAARNLILMYAKQTETDIVEDVVGSRSLKFGLIGKGKAIIFRDGERINGKWIGMPDRPPIFTNAAGKRVLLNRGNLWIEVVPTAMKVTIK